MGFSLVAEAIMNQIIEIACSEILKSSASLLEFHGFIRFYEYPFSVLNPIEMDIHS